jgi:hypothetical protein
MTFAGWCRSVINGWRMQRALSESLRSLRSVHAERWLPVHRMPGDELEASVVTFLWFARVHGMPNEDVAAAIRTLRDEHAHAASVRTTSSRADGERLLS